MNFNFCSTFEQNVYISNSTGHDKRNCVTNSRPNNTCATLDYVLEIISNDSELGFKLRNSTKIQIQGHQFLQKNYTLTALNNFAVSGDTEGSVIECKSHRGLVIVSSKDITIELMTFLNCGSIQTAQKNKNISFQAGLFFSNIANLNVSGCMITNSTGIGIALLNVGGQVFFTHTHFVGNINNSKNGSKVKSGLAKVGGGLIVEFTYHNTENSNVQSSSNNNYTFYNCTFINNGCAWNSKSDQQPTEASKNNVIFGCGGGMAMTFKGKAQGNTVRLEYCNFTRNLADWGGGYYILFEDKSYNNFALLKNVTAESNHGVLSGGGGRFFFGPCFNRTEVFELQPNFFQQENCSYLHNYAGWGGGVSVYGSNGFKISHPDKTSLLFSHSRWVKNRAVVASALGFLSNSIELQNWFDEEVCIRLPYTVKLQKCEFIENSIISNIQEDTKTFMVGTGTVYVDEAPIIMGNVRFALNHGTPLVLDLSNVYIISNVIFHDNVGDEGGAIALYGRSNIILAENSSLNFTSNRAYLRGGAIYAYSQGPNLKAFQVNLFSRSTCFFSYSKPNVHPNKWSTRVTFQNNTAPSKSGKSIYCDTLQFCRVYGNITEALKWKPFEYINSSTGEPEIVTDPIEIDTTSKSWTGFPGQQITPNVVLRDEKGHPTNGLLKMSVASSTDSKVKLGKQVSEYIYISNNRSSVPVSFYSNKTAGNFTLTLTSVYTQVIKSTVSNITTTSCYGGYTFDEQKCVCIPQKERPYGYRRCGQDGETIYLKEGYWATIGKNGAFLVYPCPLDYCSCAKKSSATAEKSNECVFTKFQKNTSQCAERRKGRLCGSCEDGYSVVVGVNDCRVCRDNLGLLWLLAIIFGLTLIVLAIIYFEIDFFSGPLNSWLYTYHIVHLLPSNKYYLDPFITFVISLTNGTFDINTGKCMIDGLVKIKKVALQYLMPFYCILLLYFINKLLHCFPNLPLANRSFHHAFVTVVIISYASLIQTTVTILQPVHVDDGWYVFEQADWKFFGKHHLPYAIPALLILVFLVIPFPFVIAFSSYFIRRFQRLRRFLPLFEAIQMPYRPNRSWFASYYIFCRLFLITVLTFRNIYEHTIFPFLEGICVIILLIFVLLQPYKEENYVYFRVDACFLSLLCLIICVVNSMEVNVENLDVQVFRAMARIMVYIPFVYSFMLLIRYVYRRVKVYKLERAGSNEPLT